MRKAAVLALALLVSCGSRPFAEKGEMAGSWRVCVKDGYGQIGGVTFNRCILIRLDENGESFWKSRNGWQKNSPWRIEGNSLLFKTGLFGTELQFYRKEGSCLIFKSGKKLYRFCRQTGAPS